MRWEKRKTLAPELRQRPWRRMTSYYDSSYRRLEQYFTRILDGCVGHFSSYKLRLLSQMHSPILYVVAPSFLRQELLQHKYIFVLIVHSDGEDYRILFEKSFYQKKLKSVFRVWQWLLNFIVYVSNNGTPLFDKSDSVKISWVFEQKTAASTDFIVGLIFFLGEIKA